MRPRPSEPSGIVTSTRSPSWAMAWRLASSSTVTTRLVELVSSTSEPELSTLPTEVLCSPTRRGPGQEHDPPELDRAGLLEPEGLLPVAHRGGRGRGEGVVDGAGVEAERGEVLLQLATSRPSRRPTGAPGRRASSRTSARSGRRRGGRAPRRAPRRAGPRQAGDRAGAVVGARTSRGWRVRGVGARGGGVRRRRRRRCGRVGWACWGLELLVAVAGPGPGSRSGWSVSLRLVHLPAVEGVVRGGSSRRASLRRVLVRRVAPPPRVVGLSPPSPPPPPAGRAG